MKDYLLFVDTETSGLPADWSLPYSADDNWPYIVQLAWVVYTKDGERVKGENHYLRIGDHPINPTSSQIHGITPEFLEQHGQDPHVVLQQLQDDLYEYRPLVVGHFMQLDFHMVGAGFFRSDLINPLPQLPTFCTMKVTAQFVRPSRQRYLSLGQLYERLFHEKLNNQHDAWVDVQATAECFFELWRKGDIDEQIVLHQQPDSGSLYPAPRPPRRWLRWLGL
ncbi:exonuclease domain-containing protein [Hymenobacter sp. BT491]|uniref:3'-5' exonuclease n=1 Tax=Hymenobacter sp. BT491 TaxID=2766779 RepID=UPI0016537C9F|nr:3'-5' exonuclease [Hymenobacter sp. BT491]MBC6989407.1 3'-5' exonuclease [Hymenobacter sp. BT491]